MYNGFCQIDIVESWGWRIYMATAKSAVRKGNDLQLILKAKEWK